MKANFKVEINCYSQKELKYILVYNFTDKIIHYYINWEQSFTSAIGIWKIKPTI